MSYKKSQTYEQFSQMSLQQRKLAFDYFIKSKPDFIPVILQNLSHGQLPELKTCKFLISRKSQMSLEIAQIRQHIVKNSVNKIGKDDQLFFLSKGSLINMSMKAHKHFQDRWFLISYSKQATF